MAGSFTALHSYSDPGLDKKNYYDHELSVRLSAEAIAYCVYDSSSGKFLHLESFDLREPGRKLYMPGDKEKNKTTKITTLLESDLNWLTQKYSKHRILIDQGSATLVPEALYREEKKTNIFEFNVAGGPYADEEIHADHIQSLNTFAIYHMPSSIKDLLNRFFPDPITYHYSTTILQSLFLKHMNQENEKQLFVNTGRSRLDIIRFKGKKLEYYNSFRYNTAEDFMYYLIFVLEQLGLNPESVELMMMGEVDKHSTLSDLVHKYVRNIKFVERNNDFRYSFVFDQLPGHYYFNLLNASLCES